MSDPAEGDPKSPIPTLANCKRAALKAGFTDAGYAWLVAVELGISPGIPVGPARRVLLMERCLDKQWAVCCNLWAESEPPCSDAIIEDLFE